MLAPERSKSPAALLLIDSPPTAPPLLMMLVMGVVAGIRTVERKRDGGRRGSAAMLLAKLTVLLAEVAALLNVYAPAVVAEAGSRTMEALKVSVTLVPVKVERIEVVPLGREEERVTNVRPVSCRWCRTRPRCRRRCSSHRDWR